jgi:hypothetical protein
MIKVDYRFESDEMSDEEYGNQEEREFIITKEMIIDIIKDNISIPKGHEICTENIYTKRI